MKLCKDCKHVAKDFIGEPVCKHPDALARDTTFLASGRLPFCFSERGMFGGCGESGKRWELAPIKPRLPWWQRWLMRATET